jgi:linoleate 10R-lipoxygenase
LPNSADAPTITAFENIGFFTHQFFEETVSAVLKVILGLGHIDRVSGPAGTLHRFTETFMGTLKTQYTNDEGKVTPWPESMVIQVMLINVEYPSTHAY